ncbi:MAG: NADH-quinone oxidoreductase subunit L [Chloroflexota bacterium]|nr:NADH-quinone oxidoreductase subunit L [Chloroflexota bacterium]
MIEYVWIIPLLPLLGVIINTFFGRMLPRKTAAWLATGLVGIGAALSLGIIFQIRGLGEEFHGATVTLYQWMAAGDFSVDFAFFVDQLSALMLIVVTGVGFLIHMYSIGYMEHDEDIHRYFVYLNLFIFAMLMLVLGDNYLLLFLGWEGVGLCSYLLISFWYTDPFNAYAGKKAFIVNRIGDFAVLLGIFLVWTTFGTLAFTEVFPLAEEATVAVLTGITLLFFIGCTGKSAQIPLFVWLPDAMAGPTPVSALIHAATMVTAGVYLLVRSAPLLEPAGLTQDVVAWIGALTALFAATIALTQMDIKRVLAYSTVSQLGYMFLGVGAGAYVAAIFHLFTHAFFKALLFLGSGSVMHAMEHGLHHVQAHHEAHSDDEHAHGVVGVYDDDEVEGDALEGVTVYAEPDEEHPAEAEAHAEMPSHDFDVQDMRNMGGLWNKTPITAWTFLIGGLALAGFPLTSGFFSKDEILTLTQHDGRTILYIIGLITAFMTAFYTFRQFFLVFWGEPRTEAAEHASESPPTMTIPLAVLAFFALLGGLIFGLPLESGIIHDWLEPPLEAFIEHGEGGISVMASLLISSVVAIAGIGLAYVMYATRQVDPEDVAETAGPLYEGSLNKWYIDEIYDATFVRFYEWLATWSARFFDKLVIDGAVNGVAALFGGFGSLLGRLQSGFVRSYALSIVLGLLVVAVILGFTLPGEAGSEYLEALVGPVVVAIGLIVALLVLGLIISFFGGGRGPGGPSARTTSGGAMVIGDESSVSENISPAMRRTITWLVAFVLAIPVTYVLFQLLEIDFFSAGAFTLLAIIMMGVLFALVLDSVLNTGVFDEHGWHLGFLDTTGPLVPDDPEPSEDYEPIVSREERLRQQRGK